MNKKKVIIIVSIILVILVIAGLYGTLASDETALSGDNIYNITLTGSSNEVVVPAGSSKTVIYQITNTNKGKVNYGLVFAGDNIDVKVYDDSIDLQTGLIDYGETKFVKLIITNTGETDSTASVKTVLGYENDSNLEQSNLVPSGHTFVTEQYTKPSSGGSGSGSESGDDTSDNILINHIKNLYKNNYDSSKNVTFADGTGMNYYAPSVRLMNDGLDSSGNMVDEASAVNGTAGNIRYYGSDDVNELKNYIYFNCSDYSNQSDSTCEKWRIVGIVDGKVEIVSAFLPDGYAWDENFSNDWNNATLKSVLNEGGIYYSSILSKNSETISLISTSSWYINPGESDEVYANQIFYEERTGNDIWNGDIALLYPSDYGYAMDLNSCKGKLIDYGTNLYKGNCTYNWMYNWIVNQDDCILSWLLTPDYGITYRVWGVWGYAGYLLTGGNMDVEVDFYSSIGDMNGSAVAPTLYLRTNLGIDTTTDGSLNNPYKLIVE